MKKIIINTLILSFCTFFISACDNAAVSHKKTLEEGLVDSFAASGPEIAEQVEGIVTASKKGDYETAMNDLGMLSASKIHSREQERAINLLMARLRFTMEEEELAAKLKTVDKQPN